MVEDVDLKYARDFALLAAELHREAREQPTLERIVQTAVETVEGCDFCGVSAREPDGRIWTPASTDPIADQADALQYELGEGPCLEAIWSLDTYTIDDMSFEARWPTWAPRAAGLGIGSVLSVQVETPEGQALAGLNLYAVGPYAFDHTDVAIASILARHAGNALTDARRQTELRSAIRSRQIIGVAQGILIQRFGLSLDQAFEMLRRYSQDNNVKLRDLAENLVRSGGIRNEPEDPAVTLGDTLNEAFGLSPDDLGEAAASGSNSDGPSSGS
ncbi:MAG TPA: GAF and ANTAR domain-containing protein [Microlunatus sp.]